MAGQNAQIGIQAVQRLYPKLLSFENIIIETHNMPKKYNVFMVFVLIDGGMPRLCPRSRPPSHELN